MILEQNLEKFYTILQKRGEEVVNNEQNGVPKKRKRRIREGGAAHSFVHRDLRAMYERSAEEGSAQQ